MEHVTIQKFEFTTSPDTFEEFAAQWRDLVPRHKIKYVIFSGLSNKLTIEMEETK